MKKILLPLIALALSSPAAAQSIVVVTAPHADSDVRHIILDFGDQPFPVMVATAGLPRL